MQKRKSAVNINNHEALALVRAAQGLTLTEAENAFAKAVVNDSVLDVKDVALILKEKQQIIRKSGILDFYPAESHLNEIGGLGHLKHWLDVRGKAFSQQATQFGLPSPKGVLLLGAPGCGKSLTAKAVANAWQMPLLRLDFGRIFSGLVGSSEENMRRALKVAEGVAPAVLWIDEIEKGLAGNTQGSSDGGTAARVFGTFLTWMQEKTAKVFVVATANRIDALPPELLRRGRFDEIFFMDLPQPGSRKEILEIHLKKRKREVAGFDLSEIVKRTEGFSGAEIEHCVVEGLFAAYHQNRELKTEDVLRATDETVPLSVTYAEELKRIREWARNRARPADFQEEAGIRGKRASHLE
jgi:SpoVK/Ycf46/Vps4 family AAA+-type ATPase